MKGIPSGKMPTYGTGKGDSPAANVAGNAGKALPAKPIPGPVKPGPPISLQKALKLTPDGKKR